MLTYHIIHSYKGRRRRDHTMRRLRVRHLGLYVRQQWQRVWRPIASRPTGSEGGDWAGLSVRLHCPPEHGQATASDCVVGGELPGTDVLAGAGIQKTIL